MMKIRKCETKFTRKVYYHQDPIVTIDLHKNEITQIRH